MSTFNPNLSEFKVSLSHQDGSDSLFDGYEDFDGNIQNIFISESEKIIPYFESVKTNCLDINPEIQLKLAQDKQIIVLNINDKEEINNDSQMEDDLDLLLDGYGNLAADVDGQNITPKIMHYFDSVENNCVDIKAVNVENNLEKVLKLAQDKKIILLNDKNDKEGKFKYDPIWEEEFKDIEQVNVEDEAGKVETFRNDGVHRPFTLKKQSRAEMIAIARVVHRIALRIFEENKQNKDKIDEEPEASSHKSDSDDAAHKALKDRSVETIDSKNNAAIIKLSNTTLRKLHEITIIAEQRKKENDRKKSKEAKELNHFILLKEILNFDLNQENIKKSYIKTSMLVSEMINRMLGVKVFAAQYLRH